MTYLRNFWRDDEGQDLIEYTLLLAFVCLVAAAIFIPTGTNLGQIWSVANSRANAAAIAATAS